MKFIIEPYSIDFEVYYTDSPKNTVSSILKRNPDKSIVDELTTDWLQDDGTMASACAGFINGEFVIISIFDKKTVKDYFESTLAHEAIHVLSFIMKHTGIKYDCNNDETQAYIVDGVVRMMVKAQK